MIYSNWTVDLLSSTLDLSEFISASTSHDIFLCSLDVTNDSLFRLVTISLMPYCSQTLNGILLKRNTGFQSKKTLQLWLRWSDVKDPSKIVILILLSFQGPCWEIWEVCLNYSNWHFIGSRHSFVKKTCRGSFSNFFIWLYSYFESWFY